MLQEVVNFLLHVHRGDPNEHNKYYIDYNIYIQIKLQVSFRELLNFDLRYPIYNYHTLFLWLTSMYGMMFEHCSGDDVDGLLTTLLAILSRNKHKCL